MYPFGGVAMRTTVSIDEDILLAAKSQAAREQKTIGEVLSELARKGLQREIPVRKKRNGIPLLPARADAKVVTMELVNHLRDEIA